MAKQKIWQIILYFILILVTIILALYDFSDNEEQNNVNKTITKYISYPYCSKELPDDKCILKTNEYKDIMIGLKSLSDYNNRLINYDFDIKVNPSRVIEKTICDEGCTLKFDCKTQSMAPTFTCNDVLSLYVPFEKDLDIGDIVIYRDDKFKERIHRIIDKEGDKFIIKGDNNPDIDKYMPQAKEIMWKVAKIEYH